jgi:transposase
VCEGRVRTVSRNSVAPCWCTRLIVESIANCQSIMPAASACASRYRVGCAWRDVPRTFGPWQTLWKRHARFSRDGTWDRIHAVL